MTQALLLDLVEWVAARPRFYRETMDAWRTSCPRLTIWEDAVAGGFVKCEADRVVVTPNGSQLLHENGRAADHR